jgi:hypothetical protein
VPYKLTIELILQFSSTLTNIYIYIYIQRQSFPTLNLDINFGHHKHKEPYEGAKTCPNFCFFFLDNHYQAQELSEDLLQNWKKACGVEAHAL